MAGIYPNSDFIICRGVPLDMSYEHTLYQLNATAQYNSIHAYVKYTLDNQSYQRVNRQYLRVGIKADDLYDCNYVMFRNTSYGAKWFYAFITSVEYVNDNCSDISFEIDVMQTWYFDYQLGECFVEREHTITDRFGESLIEEGIECGDLLVRGTISKHYPAQSASALPEYYAVIYYIPNEEDFVSRTTGQNYQIPDTEPYSSGVLGYMVFNFTPFAGRCFSIPFYSSNVAGFLFALSAIVRKLVEISAEICSIQFVPFEIANDYNVPSGAPVQAVTRRTITIGEGQAFKYAAKNGYYTPKNKKLYQYPFSQLAVTNNSGQSQEFKWELFAQSTSNVVATFNLVTAVIPEVVAHLYPLNYRQGNSIELGVTVSGFPTINWSEDSFQRWWNVNKQSWTLGLVGGCVDTLARLGVTSAVASGLMGTARKVESAALNAISPSNTRWQNATNVNTADRARNAYETTKTGAQISNLFTEIKGSERIAQSVAQYKSAKATPDGVKGQSQTPAVLIEEGRIGFTAYDMCVSGEYAEMIDDFFSMYGYAIKKIKTPNVHGASHSVLRPHWNYIKTGNCVIHSANFNMQDQKAIEEIYNSGITFWMHANEVGNYELSNNPVV